MILSNSVELAEGLDKIAFPGITANVDLSPVAAVVISVLDLLTHGQDMLECALPKPKRSRKFCIQEDVNFFRFPEKVLRISNMLLFQP